MSGGASGTPRRSHARLETIALGGIALFGAVLRVRQWFEARSLWLDETSLAQSFNQLGFPGIVTQPLLGNQSAPPGYLFATQAASRVFGFDERALRLTALLAGLATMAVAVIVARRLLSHPVARIAFVALVALSPALIYYSNELKQYSTDVLALMVVLALWSLRDHPRRVPFLAVGGFLIAIFSLVGIIALLAFGVAYAIEHLSHRSGDHASTDTDPPQPAESRRQRAVVAGVWAAGIALHAWYSLRSGTDREFMQTYWGDRGAFPPQSIGSIGELEWYPLSIMRLIWVGIGEEVRIGERAATGSALATVIVIALFVVMLRTRRDLRSLVLTIFAFAWVLAELRIYPTSGRLSLYVVPIVFIAIASGLDSLLQTRRAFPSILALGGVGVLLFIQAGFALNYLKDPLNDRDMKWALSQIEEHRANDDLLVVNSGTRRIVQWYLPTEVKLGLTRIDVNFSEFEASGLPDELLNGSHERFWIVSTHRNWEALTLRDALVAEGLIDLCTFNADGTMLSLLSRQVTGTEAEPDPSCDFMTSR